MATWKINLKERIVKRLPHQVIQTKSSFIGNSLALIFLGIIFYLNLSTVYKTLPVPNLILAIAHTARITQEWRMYAPSPPKNDG